MRRIQRLFIVFISIFMLFSLLASPLFTNRGVVRAQEELPTPTLTAEPTLSPDEPTAQPTEVPTALPTEALTPEPTLDPTGVPTEEPAPDAGPEIVPLLNASASDAVPDEYIIVYKKGTAASQEMDRNVKNVKAMGGKVKHEYQAVFKGFAARLTAEMLDRLRRNPNIAYIEQVTLVSTSESQPNPPSWGLDRVDQRNLPLDNTYNYPSSAGAGVHVYIVDSGILASHVQFTGRVGNGIDYVDDDTSPNDCGDGHGTHVAGTIGGSTVGVAKSVTLHAVRVLGCDGSGGSDDVIAGLNWILNNHIDPAVVNMSLGAAIVISSIDDAVETLVNNGITVVVAAGNDDVDACTGSPAREPSAITVAASTNTDARASFSNWGSCVDIFAPGDFIYSSVITCTSCYDNMWSGTSMASPHVAGGAALYLGDHPAASPAEVTNYLVNNSTKDVISGESGSPDRLLFTFAPAVPPAAPTLASPASGALTADTTPLVSWNSVENANSYEVLLASDSSFLNIKTGFPVFTSATSLELPVLSPDGNYYWKVRALDGTGESGPWSASRYFTIDSTGPNAPVLTKPVNGSQVTGTPTFTWLAAATAKYYQFQFDDLNDGPVTYDYLSISVTTLTHKPSISLPLMTPLYWSVRAQDALGNWGSWSAPFAVTVAPPVPAVPVLNAPLNKFLTSVPVVELSWKSAAYAATYDVQVDNASSFSLPLVQEYAAISSLSQTLASLPDGKYYWRARAKNINGKYSAWSAYRVFTIDTKPPNIPGMVKPLNGAQVVGMPKFVWLEVTGARNYQMQYDAVNDGSNDTYLYRSPPLLSTYAHKPPVTPPLMTPLYWSVRAQDAAGNWSAWSVPWVVTVASLY